MSEIDAVLSASQSREDSWDKWLDRMLLQVFKGENV